MGMLLDIVGGLSICVSTLWDLQEMRFSAIFDDVSSVAMAVIMAAVSCFIATRRL
ncbi:hypothetical protein I3843_06G157900 [Carya illinoinensis]|uniref:Uncharacterized protein n=1 Tax=Carya illinoinensis TaxID=32201 RepID=A0A922EU30_CARIL|nr:hypothetical protein I3760_06G166900 [Carya illinoinensis]KAG2704064.1 hypothetical protein I3760_06G166900 [Carya illinoinensis]KAG6710097.1 hypothetical protein I3842_06G166600 [Carya illinoinensis]KAG6710098.1 hypothetical protein I3842_06G166600 [Carya illinoinensis]KAG7976591.1 hypothetical protein I3843_06G157900 [Carya illinoinensis]